MISITPPFWLAVMFWKYTFCINVFPKSISRNPPLLWEWMFLAEQLKKTIFRTFAKWIEVSLVDDEFINNEFPIIKLSIFFTKNKPENCAVELQSIILSNVTLTEPIIRKCPPYLASEL